MLSFYSGVALSVPCLGCDAGSSVADKSWAVPGLLSHICDAKTLKEIGNDYRHKYPGESNEEQLARLLLEDRDHKIIPVNTEDAFIRSLLENKIKRDFQVGNTVVIKGWVLSKTEAQQCALYSLSQN